MQRSRLPVSNPEPLLAGSVLPRLRPRGLAWVVLLGSLTLPACQNTCEKACSKLINDCQAQFPSYNAKTCEEECTVIQEEYKSHDYLEPEQTAFQTQLDCIAESECSALLDPNAPACFNDDTRRLWAIKP